MAAWDSLRPTGTWTRYLLALATGYGSALVYNGSQLLLVPLYLHALGKYQFGTLMMAVGFVNFAGAGVAGLTGAMLRVLGEHSARRDEEGFARAFSLLRAGYLVYAALLGLLFLAALHLSADSWLSDASSEERAALRSGLVLCAFYIVVLYDSQVERLALTAAGRQPAANWLFTLNVLVYVSLVVPWLLTDGTFEGVIACLIVGSAVASVAGRIYRRRVGLRSARLRFDSGSSLVLRRILGPIGAAYFAYGFIGLAMGADVLIVGWLGSAIVAAEFTLVWKPAEILTQLIWKIPEHSMPFLIHMDALGEKDRLARLYARSLKWITVLACAAGIAYAAIGPWLVQRWVGDVGALDRTAFVLAGAAVFWLSIARLPSVFAYSTVRLRQLLIVAGVEVIAKTALTFALFSRAGYLSPLISINLVHVLGVAIAYRRLMPASSSKVLQRPAEVS